MRVWIRGAGDLATGIAVRLYRCGMQIVMTETGVPTTVRRTVAFSRAVYEPGREAEVEGITGRLVHSEAELLRCFEVGQVAVTIDPEGTHRDRYQADILVDAILAKKNLGTGITDAPLVIGVGPGFTAGLDCHYVVETNRGHTLGRVISQGAAIPNTGVPGELGGFSVERLIRAEADGVFVPLKQIGDRVEAGEIVALSGGVPVRARMTGMIRGMLQDNGLHVKKEMKCGDIDARCITQDCYLVSDKALAVAGGVLEAILRKWPLNQTKVK